MADTTTTTYGFTKPEVNASQNTWGQKLNDNMDSIDAAIAGVAAFKVPSGGIIMWSGLITAIPSGWYLCDGTNGTPDLRGRFVVGAGGAYGEGDSGGNASITLTTSQLPSHTHGVNLTSSSGGEHTHTVSGTAASGGSHSHTASTGTAGDHKHGLRSNADSDSVVRGFADGYSPQGVGAIPYGTAGTYYTTFPTGGQDVMSTTGAHTHSVSVASGGAHTHTVSGTAASAGSHSHTISGSTDAAGGGSSIDIRPPYYALAFIMKG